MSEDEFFTIPEEVIDPKLKRAQSLVGSNNVDRDFEWYPTPPYATQALLDREKFEGDIWESACGAGDMSEVIKANGYNVISTDLVDRGYGTAPHDFLTSDITCDNMMTNPPFTLAEEFVRLGLQRTTKKVVLLTKLAFLEGAKRKIMFESTPLKTVYVFSKRLSMTKNGEKMKNSGMIAFSFMVFDHSYEGKPTIEWI